MDKFFNKSTDFIYKVNDYYSVKTEWLVKGLLIFVLSVVVILFLLQIIKALRLNHKIKKGLIKVEDVKKAKNSNRLTAGIGIALIAIALGLGAYGYQSYSNYLMGNRFAYSETIIKEVMKLPKQEGKFSKIEDLGLVENSTNTYLFKGYSKGYNNRNYGQYGSDFKDIHRVMIQIGKHAYKFDAKIYLAKKKSDLNKVVFYKDKKGNILNASVYLDKTTYNKMQKNN